MPTAIERPARTTALSTLPLIEGTSFVYMSRRRWESNVS